MGGGGGWGNNNFDFVAAISVDFPFSRPLPQYVIKCSLHSGKHYRIIINLKKEKKKKLTKIKIMNFFSDKASGLPSMTSKTLVTSN